ncbi:MAG: gliding motility-associated ABC transporter permease subunit GldF [Flavobacteriaceae bacterium]|nr:gliding motility-associated ABC transporter permease subunit GldF [Flavobacteriaceae bacterium]
MNAIIKKELFSFFASSIGFMAIGVFLVLNGIFLWIINNDFNILHAGFADLNSFFYLIPWVFIFLIPAITMRMISDEYRLGTIEILKTKPISLWNIILGKYLAALILVIISLLLTATYIYTIFVLANPIGNIDFGVITGSYFGLILLASAYTSIGIFTSSLSQNQMIAFILGVVISYLLFFGFEHFIQFFDTETFYIQQLGLYHHYKSISKGVIDTRDLIYFLSVSFFFLYLTKLKLDHE